MFKIYLKNPKIFKKHQNTKTMQILFIEFLQNKNGVDQNMVYHVGFV